MTRFSVYKHDATQGRSQNFVPERGNSGLKIACILREHISALRVKKCISCVIEFLTIESIMIGQVNFGKSAVRHLLLILGLKG